MFNRRRTDTPEKSAALTGLEGCAVRLLTEARGEIDRAAVMLGDHADHPLNRIERAWDLVSDAKVQLIRAEHQLRRMAREYNNGGGK